MSTAATNRRLRSILVGMKDQSLIVNPSFQRRLVWINKHKVAFIETVLAGLPFPEVFIAAGEVDVETGRGTEVVVDGQQRLTTLYHYFVGSGEIDLGSVEPYRSLQEDEKKAFLEYEVVVRDLGSLTEQQTRDLFQKINSTSYGLNAMEVNNGRYDGELKKFCELYIDHQFLSDNNVFSVQDGRRMNDTKWVLTLVITMLSTYFNRDSEHQNYLSQYNEAFPHESEIRLRLGKALEGATVISAHLNGTKRIFQKSDLFSLLVELDRISPEPNDLKIIASRLAEFYTEVDGVASRAIVSGSPRAHEYFAAIRSGTNDSSSRRNRGRIIAELLTLDLS